MTNYLFLRGNRNKHFFIDIADELIKGGHQCHQMKFELGELLFKGKANSIFAPFQVGKKEYAISDERLMDMEIYNITFRQRILKKNVKPSELKRYKRYMYLIDRYIEEKSIKEVCLFNGYHWIDQVTRYIATERNLKIHIIEDGLFRPYTVTCDGKGINARSSVPVSEGFYDALEIDRTRLRKFLFEPENEELKGRGSENLLGVAALKAVNMIGSALGLSPKLYVHINFYQAMKYFLHKQKFKRKASDRLEWPGEYIFLPFQVNRDTQILYNSPNVRSMEELFHLVLHAVQQYNRENGKDLKLIVKEHPEDMSRNRYKGLKKKYRNSDRVLFIQKYDLRKLVERATVVVTINSTVGIEALALGKKVITLGLASYNIPGVATHCNDPKKLNEVLAQVIDEEINEERIEKFLYYLRFTYQIEGTIFSRSGVTARNVVKRITSQNHKKKECVNE